MEAGTLAGEGVQQKEGSPHEVVWTFDASLPFVVCICEEAIGGAPEIIFTLRAAIRAALRGACYLAGAVSEVFSSSSFLAR